MKKWLVYFLLGALYTPVLAQNSMFEDSEGQSAFKVNNNSLIVNSGQQSIKFDFFKSFHVEEQTTYFDHFTIMENENLDKYNVLLLPDKWESIVLQPGQTVTTEQGNTYSAGGTRVYRVHHKRKFPDKFGITLNAIANTGVSNLFDDGELDPTGEIKFSYTAYGKNERSISNFDYFVFSGGINAESVSLIDTSNFAMGALNEKTLGYSLEIAYNRVGYIKTSDDSWHNFFFGASASYEVGDNANELNQSEFTVTNVLENTATQTITSTSSLKGILQELYINSREVFNFNMDAAILPKSLDERILFAGHYRGKSIEDNKYISNAGAGIYITDKDATSKIVGGINFIFQDIFGEETSNSMLQRLSINIVAGFKI